MESALDIWGIGIATPAPLSWTKQAVLKWPFFSPQNCKSSVFLKQDIFLYEELAFLFRTLPTHHSPQIIIPVSQLSGLLTFYFSLYLWQSKTNRDAIKITIELKPRKNHFLGRRAFLSGFYIKQTVRGTFELSTVWPWSVLSCHLVSTGELHSLFSFLDDQLCNHLFLGNTGSLKRTGLPLKCQNGENSSRMLWGKTDWRERYFHFHSLGANSGQR